MALPVLVAQAAAIAARPALSLSKAPTVVNYGDYAVIELDQVDQEQIAAFILRQLDGEPGAVRVQGLGGVVLRVLARKYWGHLAGAAGGFFGLGWLTSASKKGRGK